MIPATSCRISPRLVLSLVFAFMLVLLSLPGVSLAQSPVPEVTKDVNDDTVYPGQMVNFTIVYSNTGTGPGTGMTLTDDMAGGALHLVSCDSSPVLTCSVSAVSNQPEWYVGDLGAGAGGMLTITAMVDEWQPLGEILTNTVSFTDWFAGPSSVYASADMTLPQPELAITKTLVGDAPEYPGQLVTYTIDYNHLGSEAAATHVVLADPLPGALTWLDYTSTPEIGPLRESFGSEWTALRVGYADGYVYALAVGDLDGDGDLDIVSGDTDDGIVAWQNNGTPFASGTWDAATIGSGGGAVMALALGDLDGDGDLDLVSGDDDDDLLAWENPDSPWDGSWSSTLVDGVYDIFFGVNSVALGDVDGDGDLDIVSGDQNQNVMAWTNDGTPFVGGGWEQVVVGSADSSVDSVALGDMDADGDLDIVAGGYTFVTVWENDGTPWGSYWWHNEISELERDFFVVAIGDLDQDGYPDVVSGDGYADTYAWRNDGTPFSDGWQATHVGESLFDVRSVALGDLDNDGDVDIITGGYPLVMAWQNDGVPWNESWTENYVGAKRSPVEALVLGDLDKDGYLDIISGDRDNYVFAWQAPAAKAGWYLPTLTEGAGGTITLMASVRDSAAVGKTITNTVTMSATGAVSAVSDSAGFSMAAPDLEVTKTVSDDTVYPGQTVTFGIDYANATGDVPAIGATVQDVLPEGMSLVSYEGTPALDPVGSRWQRSVVGEMDGEFVYAIAVGDLDSDGDLDVVAGDDDGLLRIFRNDGTPYVDAWTSVMIDDGDYAIYAIAVGDVDKDGDLDIVTGDEDGGVSLWVNPDLGSPDGDAWIDSWDDNQVGNESDGVYTLAIGDLNKNSWPDIVVGGNDGADDRVVAYQNDGTPLIGTWDGYSIGEVHDKVLSLAIGDLDGDTWPDVASGDQGGFVYVWENDETPFVDEWEQIFVAYVMGDVNTLVLGDLDNDGDLDLVSGENFNDFVQAWQNDGTPFDSVWAGVLVGGLEHFVNAVALADMNGDGHLDIVSGDDYYEVHVWSNPGLPWSGDWADTYVGDANDYVFSLAVGDLDGDGTPEIVSGDEDYTVLAWRAVTPIPSAARLSALVGSRGDYIDAVAVGDLDGDGDLDIVSGDEDDDVYIWQNDGTPFASGWPSQLVGTAGDYVFSVALGDLDGDGDLDIVSGDEDYQVRIWQNDGTPWDGAWAGNLVGSAGEYIYSVALGDLDGDNDLDIVSGDDNDDIYAWQNDGTPWTDTWVETNVGSASGEIMSVALGDLDGDGHVDIVSGDDAGYCNAWHNPGAPWSLSWTAIEVVQLEDAFSAVALGDLDGDGDLDIVSGIDTISNANVLFWPNDGSPWDGFWSRGGGAGMTGGYAETVALGDMDSDGDLDIVTGDGDGKILVWTNSGTPWSYGWARTSIGQVDDNLVSVALGDLDQDGFLDIVSGDEDNDVRAWSGAPPRYQWDVGRLEVAQGGTLTVLAKVNEDWPIGGSLTNTGYLSVAGYEVSDTAEMILPVPAMTVTKIASGDTFNPGQLVTFTITYANVDDEVASANTVISDILPSGLDYVTLDATPTVVGRQPFGGAWSGTQVGQVSVEYTGANRVAVGDLDNDGDEDIVSVDSAYEIWVWQNNGSPFEAGTWVGTHVGSVSSSMWTVALGDIDGDGDLDIATGDNANQLYIWKNDGSPWDANWDSNLVGSGGQINALALGDLDGDGDLDIAAGDSSFYIYVWENDGTPWTDTWNSQEVGRPGSTFWAIALGDLDNDGDLDIVTSHDAYGVAVYAWQNNGMPFGGTWSRTTFGESTVESVVSVALGDLDGDGWLDVVTGDSDSDIYGWRNDGSPWDGYWSNRLIADTWGAVYALTLGDLDGDGDLDVAAGHDGPVTFSSSGPPWDYPWDYNYAGGHCDYGGNGGAALGDLDGDGFLDIVTADRCGNITAWQAPFSENRWFAGTVQQGAGGVLTLTAQVALPLAGDTAITNQTDVGVAGYGRQANDHAGVTVNHMAPVAVDDKRTTDEDTPITISVLTNDSDDNGDTLSVASIGTVVSGTATISGTTQIVYTPANYTKNYTTTFEYTVSDGLLTDVGQVMVVVAGDDDPPFPRDAIGPLIAPPYAQFNWQLPAGALVIEDDETNVIFGATQCDGSPLPGWLSFNPDTQTFTGFPTDAQNDQTWCIKVTAIDDQGQTGFMQFYLEVRDAHYDALLTVGPDPFCPGWFQYYTFGMTNTDTIDITNLVITQSLPVWASLAWVDATSLLPGTWDENTGLLRFEVDLIEPGASIEAKTVLHSFSQTRGEVASEVWFAATELPAWRSRTITSTVSLDTCDEVPPPDLVITGVVYGGDGVASTSLLADGTPIAGATVTATTCLPGAWVDVTDENGAYQIVIPGAVAASCDEVWLVASAEGFFEMEQSAYVDDLRNNPVRDFVLDPWYRTWLPLLRQ